MRVFLAGATGVIGRRLLPHLLEAGHDVTAMTRREDRAVALREAGAVPVVCDVFDADGLRGAVERAQPEVVVHELTDLPPALDPRKLEEQAAGNDRIRTEGTRNLVAAAVAAGARRIVAQSIAFAYPPTGAGLKHEDDPLWDDAPWPWKRSVEALHELEDAVTRTEGIEGLVLRYGFFYGPGSSYGKRWVLRARGPPPAFPDRRSRVRRVLVHPRRRRRRRHGGGSRTRRARHLQRRRRRPGAVARMAACLCRRDRGEADRGGCRASWRGCSQASTRVMLATDLRGASNERAKAELGWPPRHASWRQGFRDALG